MTNDFLKDIIKTTGNEYANLVEDGVESGDVENFIDTGSYILNVPIFPCVRHFSHAIRLC